MPDFDGGHYFLTVLAPIDNTGIVEHEGMKSSPVHMVREALETLPTALQSPATEAIGLNSPFARNRRTHFARFVVLDNVFYNGRDPADAIVSVIAKTDLVAPQPVDQIACPYLLFVADFDPDGQGGPEPRTYLESLWDMMPAELSAVFGYCYDFSQVRDRTAFADFVMACQVETTMPFNDYWVGAPPLPSLAPWLLILPPVVAAALGALYWSMGAPWYAGLGLGLLLVLAALGFDYGLVSAVGGKALPAAPNATLPHVLKALYLQQAFTGFVIDNQGADPMTLRGAFAGFVERNRLDDLASPTQPPGVVQSGAGRGA